MTVYYTAAYYNSEEEIVPIGTESKHRSHAEETLAFWLRDDPEHAHLYLIAYRDVPKWKKSYPKEQTVCSHCGVYVPMDHPGKNIEADTGKVWCSTAHALNLERIPDKYPE